MSQDFDEERCVRKRITINDENYYLVIGSTFVIATVPWENRLDRMNERKIVETLCNEITLIMEGSEPQ